MNYIEFEQYRFSQLALGTVQLGLKYGISNREGLLPIEERIRLLRTAADLGINNIDTARSYGDSEEIIGLARLRIRTELAPVITSKFGLNPSDEKNPARALQSAIDSVKLSCRQLGVKKLDVCLFHSGPNNDVQRVSEILPRIFAELNNRGLVSFGGYSIYYPEEAKVVLEIPEIKVVQVPFNLLDQRLLHDGLLGKLKLSGKFVVARSVFLQGLYFMDKSELPEKIRGAAKHLETLADLSRRYGISIPRMAVSYVRDQPGIDCLVIGAMNENQLRQNLSLISGPSLPELATQTIEDEFRHVEELIVTPGLW